MAGDAHNAMTISYGSFSVTLEGYDQPFDLLKKVTDYYCDVARNNPEFGAKPSRSHLAARPTPAPESAKEAPQRTEIEPEITKAAFVSSLEDSENLWEDPQPADKPAPLILDVPATTEEPGDLALIHAAGMPLTAPEVETPAPKQDPEPPRTKSGFLTNNYPFRHFPLRKPTPRN